MSISICIADVTAISKYGKYALLSSAALGIELFVNAMSIMRVI